MALKVGYNLFSGASQAGTNDGTTGVIQAEVDSNVAYYMKIQRLSDSYYWNETSGAFQSGNPAEADEHQMRGSEATYGGSSYLRRLSDRLPKEAIDGIDSDGVTITVYPSGGTPATDGVAITLAFELDA